MSTIAIIDYGSGNLRSAAKAFEKVAGAKHEVKVTSNINDLILASHIVLPGVGAFGDCMAGLKAIPGMIDTMQDQVFIQQKPFMGICVGMQLLAQEGKEHGIHQGLGWIKGSVISIPVAQQHIKVPHMGWNELSLNLPPHPIVNGISSGDHAYFVHSYYMDVHESGVVVATTTHGRELTAIVAKDNIVATQFHPEKSQETGQVIIANFLNM
ncbi:MAG: imidazole glycerol phosphate synthase subunit HisH [Alphaproteobacteria bacterium]|nr:imidazole glycerol phosphate synthase subunit HisH [Alphaproteobacteria bacterium]